MIRSSRLQGVLCFASTRLNGSLWRGFHEGVRRCYLGPGILFLKGALRPKGLEDQEFVLIPRHSATSKSDFNAFQSDLDLSIIVADSQLERADDIARSFYWWKGRFPFIGELELYSRAEFDELSELIVTPKNTYPVIRSIRKLSWMEHAARDAPSAYHRMKAERSIAKILSKEKIEVSAQYFYRTRFAERIAKHLDRRFGGILQDFPLAPGEFETVSVFSDYLATNLSAEAGVESGSGELKLNPAHRALLLALTPRTSFGNPEIDRFVARVRSIQAVREQWELISRMECLIFQAVLRAQLTVSEAERLWLKGFFESWQLARPH